MLRRNPDGTLDVRTDAEGRRYAVCEGMVWSLEALQRAPLPVQQEWATRVRCGQPVPLSPDPAGDPNPEQMCSDCAASLDQPAEPSLAMQVPCAYHDQGCPLVLNPGNRVAYSRRGVSLHQCRDGHFSFWPAGGGAP
jgi:hypothetical protein